VSRATGKRLYRVNVLFKMTGLARGAIINFRGEKFEVMLMNKNQAQIKNVASGEKFWKKIEDLI
jgi:NMD protein affecting ribosome stability and mRNA decay